MGDFAWSDDVISALLALTTGVLGYAFREYRNRARPFFQLTDIDGSVRKNSDVATLPSDVLGYGENSSFLLLRKACEMDQPTLLAVFKAWDHADDVQRFWPTVRVAIENFLSADDEQSKMAAFAEVISLRYFSQWLSILLAVDRIKVPRVDHSKEAVVTITESDELEGSVWMGFPIPGQTWQFGSFLSSPVLRAKIVPFLEAVERFDSTVLAEVLNKFKEMMDKEHGISGAVRPPLKQILDANSRWLLEIYLGNLSPNPVVILTSAKLVVKDASGTLFPEGCYLVDVSYDSNMKRDIRDAKTPIVVRGGHDVTLGLMTVHRQAEMERGMAFREAFESGAALCSVELTLEKVGLFKRQRFRSQEVPFSLSRVEN